MAPLSRQRARHSLPWQPVERMHWNIASQLAVSLQVPSSPGHA